MVLAEPPRAVWRPVLTGPDAACDPRPGFLDAAAGGGRRPRPGSPSGPTPSTPWSTPRPGGAARLGQAQHRPGRGSGGPGLAGRADRRRPDVRAPTRPPSPGSRPWSVAGRPTPSPARCGRASGWSSRMRRRPRTGRSGSGCRPRTSRAWSPTPTRSGVPAGRCPRWPARSTPRRRRSWPSWARPAGCTRSWTTLCARPAPRPRPRRRRRAPVPQQRGADPGHGRVRRPAAGLVDQAVVPARAAADRRHAAPARAGLGRRCRGRLRLHRRVPLRPRGRRRGADRRRAGRAGRRSTPLVRLRGQWIELDARRLAAGLKLVGRTGTLTVGELLRLGLGVDPAPDDLPVEGVAADGWLGDLLSGRTRAPARAGRRPRTRSRAGCGRTRRAVWPGWTSCDRTGLGGVLADDMGLGKTVQLLALLAYDARRRGRPTLLICPMSLVGNWQREAARFTPQLRVHVHHGAERARGHAVRRGRRRLRPGRHHLRARRPGRGRPAPIAWRRVVVDEAQAIKNAATKQATAIRSHPGRHPDRGHRHAGGEPARRPLVDPGVRQPGPARVGRDLQEAVRRADRAARRRGRRGAAAPVHRAVHPAPGQDRPDRSSPTCRRSWRWTCSAT